MDAIFAKFREALETRNGYLLASTITPQSPSDKPAQLAEFVRSSNAQQIHTDVRYATVYDKSLSLTTDESKAWLEIYTAFWKAAAGVVAASTQARIPAGHWSAVYDTWKEVLNALIRGYNSGALAAWTVPCLYVAGKYLRNFAILADAQASKLQGSAIFNGGFQDDAVGTIGRHEKLEDAARQINRIFSLCISDRCVCSNSNSHPKYEKQNAENRLQSTNCGLTQMGHLLHHQFDVQDILQGQIALR